MSHVDCKKWLSILKWSNVACRFQEMTMSPVAIFDIFLSTLKWFNVICRFKKKAVSPCWTKGLKAPLLANRWIWHSSGRGWGGGGVLMTYWGGASCHGARDCHPVMTETPRPTFRKKRDVSCPSPDLVFICN